MFGPPARRKPQNPVLTTITGTIRQTVHWGFIPMIIWLGFKHGSDPGMPPLTWDSLLWA